MLRTAAVLTLAVLAASCTRSSLESPQEVVLILETNIRLSEYDAEVAVRVRNEEDNEALVHIQCGDIAETVVASYGMLSDEVCGLRFEMVEWRMRDNEVNAAVLKMHFDDGREDEAVEGEAPTEESASDEGSAS